LIHSAPAPTSLSDSSMGNKSSRHSLHLLCNRIDDCRSTPHWNICARIFFDPPVHSATTNTKFDLGRVDIDKRLCETLFNANSRTPILRHRHPLSHRSPPPQKRKGRTSAGFSTSHPYPPPEIQKISDFTRGRPPL
jgi:hypothetical protein